MTSTPTLTDRTALMRYRARAQTEALFLHHTARDEVEDRLTLVNRAFTHAAVVTPFAQVWDGFEAHVVGDGDLLELEPGAHDLVIHAMGLHWANDPLGQIIQCLRALRPDGLFLAVMLGGQTLHELRAALAEAEIQATGGISPRVAPMGEIRDLGALLQRAGLALPVADSLPLTASYASPLHLMHELRAMGEANALAGRLRHATRRDVMLGAVARYVEAFGQDDGRVPATYELIFLHGWAPDASQPKPLRPGSATARLADVLGTAETPLKD